MFAPMTLRTTLRFVGIPLKVQPTIHRNSSGNQRGRPLDHTGSR